MHGLVTKIRNRAKLTLNSIVFSIEEVDVKVVAYADEEGKFPGILRPTFYRSPILVWR